MGQAAAVAMMGAQVLGGVLKAKGTMDQARAQAEAARWNAAMSIERGLAEEARRRREGRRELSRQRTAYGKSGVTLEGSPMEFLAQNAAEMELDAANARIEGFTTARLERKRAKNTIREGRLAAGAAILSGIGGAVGTGYNLGTFGGGGR